MYTTTNNNNRKLRPAITPTVRKQKLNIKQRRSILVLGKVRTTAIN